MKSCSALASSPGVEMSRRKNNLDAPARSYARLRQALFVAGGTTALTSRSFPSAFVAHALYVNRLVCVPAGPSRRRALGDHQYIARQGLGVASEHRACQVHFVFLCSRGAPRGAGHAQVAIIFAGKPYQQACTFTYILQFEVNLSHPLSHKAKRLYSRRGVGCRGNYRCHCCTLPIVVDSRALLSDKLTPTTTTVCVRCTVAKQQSHTNANRPQPSEQKGTQARRKDATARDRAITLIAGL